MCASGIGSYITVRLVLDILSELGLIKCRYFKDGCAVTMCPVDGKLELSRSSVYRKANAEE